MDSTMEDDDDFMLIDELIAVTKNVELEHDKSANRDTVEAQIDAAFPGSEPLSTQPTPVAPGDEIAIAIIVPQMTEIPQFTCTGEDSTRSLFHQRGFVCQHFANRSVRDDCDDAAAEPIFGMRLSDETFASPEMLGVLFQKARMNCQQLDIAARDNAKLIGGASSSSSSASSLSSLSFYQLRHDVTALLFRLWRMQRQSADDCWLEPEPVARGLHQLDMLLGSVESMPCIRIVQTACRCEGNASTSPAYHLLHGQLEWRLLRLAIRVEMYRQHAAIAAERLTEEFQRFVQDLCVLALAKYARMKRVDMLYSTPFVCTCVKEMWLCVQLMLEELRSRDGDAGGGGDGEEDGVLMPFWSYLNESLVRVRDRTDVYDELRPHESGVRFTVPQRLAAPEQWTEFAIWLVCGVAQLHGFDAAGRFWGYSQRNSRRVCDNYELLDGLLGDFLLNEPSEEVLRVTLFAVMPVLTQWWQPKTDVLLVMWEYFHKKLNSSFFLQGSAPSTLAVVNVSVIAYLNQIETKITSTDTNPNETSFSMFIHIFGRVLRRFSSTDDTQIKKIFGRITSKFSAPKLLTLNETGIHNLASLFLTLAHTTKFSETGRRLQAILLQLPLSKLTPARQVSLTRAHVALLVLFARRQLNIGTYVQKLLEQLATIKPDGDGHSAAQRFLADAFVDIFATASDGGRGCSGEHLLFDVWLPRYLGQCSVGERERLLACVNAVLERSEAMAFALDAEAARQQSVLLKALYATMLPWVLQAFVRADAGADLAALAASLCLGCSAFAGSEYRFEEVFAQFTEACVSNVHVLAAFLVGILTSGKETAKNVNQTAVIRLWIKCHICATGASADMKSLTNIVVSLEEFRSMYTGDASEIMNTKDPLCSFFSEIGLSYRNTANFQKRNHISAKVHQYLASFEKYIAAPLENTDNYPKIYSMIAIILLHCASIVYAKGQTACFFNVVMFQHVLPNHLLTGRPQKPQYVQAIHKVWHLLVMGIEKLDYRHDQHLVTVLTNLIEKWVPQFRQLVTGTGQPRQLFVGRPFINCIRECSDEMGALVLTKIATAFITLQRRQPHTQVGLVLTIWSDTFGGVKHDERKLVVLLRGSFGALAEHAMMVDEVATSKGQIFETFEQVFKCECYRQSDEARQIVIAALRSVTAKHLAYFSTLYFVFMLRFAKINPSAIRESIEFVRETIANVEVMRGAGRDGKLRSELDKLEGAILAMR